MKVLKVTKLKGLLVAGLFVMLGFGAVLAVRAANSIVVAEAESGTLAGRAALNTAVTGASGDTVSFGAPHNYVAFGDSVASGDGIEYGWQWTPDGAGDGDWLQTGPDAPLWEPTTDTRPEIQSCRQSKKGYPYLVAAATGDKLYNPSCSGSSVLNGVLGTRNFSASVIGAPQLGSTKPGYGPANATYDAFKPDVISITLGMDDIGFSDVLQQCYVGTSCVTPTIDQQLNQRLTKFKSDLQLGLTEIKDRGTTAGKVPWVVLTTYYDPFNPDSAKSCNDVYLGLGQGLSATEIDWMRSKMQLMNQYIKEAATSYPKAKIADISATLAGHTFCTTDPWVYGISIWFNDFGNPAPFHPTPKGQEAIAAVVAQAIKNITY